MFLQAKISLHSIVDSTFTQPLAHMNNCTHLPSYHFNVVCPITRHTFSALKGPEQTIIFITCYPLAKLSVTFISEMLRPQLLQRNDLEQST
jgi:hypothetical protein